MRSGYNPENCKAFRNNNFHCISNLFPNYFYFSALHCISVNASFTSVHLVERLTYVRIKTLFSMLWSDDACFPTSDVTVEDIQ